MGLPYLPIRQKLNCVSLVQFSSVTSLSTRLEGLAALLFVDLLKTG